MNECGVCQTWAASQYQIKSKVQPHHELTTTQHIFLIKIYIGNIEKNGGYGS